MMCSMIHRPPGLTTDVSARTLHLGFDVLQNICLCLTEAEAYQWLTCRRVLLHEAPSVVRWGPIRIEQFNDVLYKFVRLKEVILENLSTGPSRPRSRRPPVRLRDEWERDAPLRRSFLPRENNERLVAIPPSRRHYPCAAPVPRAATEKFTPGKSQEEGMAVSITNAQPVTVTVNI